MTGNDGDLTNIHIQTHTHMRTHTYNANIYIYIYIYGEITFLINASVYSLMSASYKWTCMKKTSDAKCAYYLIKCLHFAGCEEQFEGDAHLESIREFLLFEGFFKVFR